MCIEELFSSDFLPEIVKLSGQFVNQSDASQFLNFELDVRKQLIEFGDRITENVLLEVIRDSDLIEQCIDKYRERGFTVHERNKQTTVQLYGGRTVQIRTAYMLPQKPKKKGRKRGVGKRGKQGKGVYPVLKMLGIAHQASPALQNEVTLSALNNPFSEATENLNRHGTDTCESRVRTISESVGQAALRNRDAEIEQFQNGTLPQGDTFANQRAIIAIDGGRIRTRRPKKGRKKKGQKRRAFHTEWKEPKLLTIYAIDEKGKKLNKEKLPFCDGTHKRRQRFKLLLKMYLHKTGALLAKEITFIGDGAPWITNIVNEIITEMNIDPQKVNQVLDYYHACQKLWEVIDALPKLTQKQKKRLYNKVKRQLKKGQIASVIESLGQKANGNRKAYKALRYFHNREHQCRYDLFINNNIPIGSGAVESAIRRVVNLRLKGAGMFWLEENAEAFLHLRCQLKAGRWKTFFLAMIRP